MVGGLVGANSGRSAIVSSYAAGAVSGDYGVGGLLGKNGESGIVFGSYARGEVTGIGVIGALAGSNNRSDGISSSYWSIEAARQAAGVGTGSISGAEGKTTSELQSPTSYYRDLPRLEHRH